MSSQTSDLGTSLYKGAASYGRFTATVGLIFGIFIGCSLLFGGAYTFFSADTDYVDQKTGEKKRTSNKKTGGILGSIACAIIACAAVHNNATQNYEFVAAAEGTSSAINILTSPFRRRG